MRRLAVLAFVLGCGQPTYVATGDVIAVDPAALEVTIRHEDIPGLMGAMTMPFHVRSADVLAGIGPGTRVRFELVRVGQDLTVTSLVALGTAASARPGIHDHTPHHGGVVAMIGMRHLEAVAAPDGAVQVWVTDVWRRPVAVFGEGFAPPPPKAGPETEVPHLEAVTAMAPSPDGAEAAVAVENRVLVNATAGGGLLRELPDHPGVVRGLAWSPSPPRLLITVFYDAAAHLVAAADGRELRRLPVEREGAAVAFSADGRQAAVASDAGPVAIFDLDSAAPPRMLAGTSRAAEALVFAGDRLLAAGVGGTILVWDVATGTVVARHELATSLYRAAGSSGARLVAVGGLDRRIRLIDLETGALVEEVDWHGAPVWGLAWAGTLLVSGDGDGRVGVWDFADRLRASASEKVHVSGQRF